MENTNFSYGRLQSLNLHKLWFLRYQKAEILQVKMILVAQSESGVHFIPELMINKFVNEF